MTRAALPQNYIPGTDTVKKICDTIGDWTATPGTVVADTVNVYSGAASMAVTNPGGVNVTGTITGTISWNLSQADCVCFRFYLPPDIATDPLSWLNTVYFYISKNGDFANYFYVALNYQELQPGWNYCRKHKSEFTKSGTITWENTMIRARLTHTAQTNAVKTLAWDSFGSGAKPLSRLVLSFDDGLAGVYSIAYPLLAARGMKATCYVIPDKVGDEYYMTLAQLQELYAAGWDIANHTSTHADLTAGTAAVATALTQAGADYLIANGMPRGAYHMAYPLGSFNTTVVNAVKAAGIKSARTMLAYNGFTPADPHRLPKQFELTNTCTLATFIPVLNAALLRGGTISIMGHNVTVSPAGSTEVSTAVLTEILDYIYYSKIPVCTISEWYDGLSNPRLSS